MPRRLRLLLPVFLVLWLIIPSALRAQTEGPAAVNKLLFDRTIDELNFRTMETVYDKFFTRNKFPVTLRAHQARRAFDGYAGNEEMKKLFLNYNDVSERFKNRFGKGRTDLAEFEKQLNSVVLDKNFEFFIRVLPRDERIALIRALKRLISQASAQFDASEDPAPDEVAADGAAVPPADVDAPTTTAPLTEEPMPQPEGNVTAAPPAPTREIDVSVRHDWVDYLTLLLAGASALGMLYLITSVLPDLRVRLDALADDLDQQQPGPTARRRPAPGALSEDRYEEEDEP